MEVVLYDEEFASWQTHFPEPVLRCLTCRQFKPAHRFRNRSDHVGRYGKISYCRKCDNRRKTLTNRQRSKTDPNRKLRRRISNDIRRRLKQKGALKMFRTVELLGCSISQLRQHIEKQWKPEMNWENHGTYWEIDHIRPLCSFDLTKPENQKICFHYTNHQPLTCQDNRKKSGKYFA